jgi:hypothetical protein
MLLGAGFALAQGGDPRISVSDVAFDESRRVLELKLGNEGPELITAYHVLVTQDCPEGKFNGTDAVMKLLPVLDPEQVGEWYRSSSGNGPILPRSSREISVRLDRRETSKGPCSGASVRAVSAVFADGTGAGSAEVIEQILEHRRGESEQYSRWLGPFREALSAETPAVALAALQDQMKGSDPADAATDSDDYRSGAGSAHRDIARRVAHLARLYSQSGPSAAEIGEKMLRLHELRAAALRRYE